MKTFRTANVKATLKIVNGDGYLVYKVTGIKTKEMVSFDFEDGTPKENIWENYNPELTTLSNRAKQYCEANNATLWSY